MDKLTRIKAEKDKLNKIFADIPENKKKLCAKLVENAAFMAITLEDLQEVVNSEGAIITAKNGNGFDITQEHPAQKSYVGMLAKYSSVINQLSNLLPDQKSETVTKAGENLARLVTGGKPVELR